jgi:CRISPR/Cas system-associated exonuclease Cas4 (RecB family)
MNSSNNEASRSTTRSGDSDSVSRIDTLSEWISPDIFDQWYRERTFQRNIREGSHYFNGPGTITSPERHTPNSLLQCHRKTVYKQLNAPEETRDPTGIFWFGSRFEQDIIIPFLQEAIVGEDEYVTDSLWVDYTVETESGEIQIKGATDPVIVTSDAEPILVTEIKTKQSIENTDEPSDHHKAQAHAYLKGLSEKYDRTVSDAIILYGSRTTFDIKPFHIKFDPAFWRNTVVDWAATHTQYRVDDELPPAMPEHGWECDFCSFSERCGKGNSKFKDIGPEGLLPGFVGYPKQKVVEYLEAHDEAKLTPSLAHYYPDLVDEHGAFEWKCRGCGESVPWNAIDWDGDTSALPSCPICSNSGPAAELIGPTPADQHTNKDHDSK